MDPFPHRYVVTARATDSGEIALDSRGLPTLNTALPPEFGGAGDHWSPETLLVAAVADCFALTFRGIAAASKMRWETLSCQVVGTLERPGRVTRFTAVDVQADLNVPEGTSEDLALRLLARAEETCLITRSLIATTTLHARVHVMPAAVVSARRIA